jgi:hypothetical protein
LFGNVRNALKHNQSYRGEGTTITNKFLNLNVQRIGMAVLFQKNVLIWSKYKTEALKWEAAQMKSQKTIVRSSSSGRKKKRKGADVQHILNLKSILGDIKQYKKKWRDRKKNGITSSAEAIFSVVTSGTTDMGRPKQRRKTRNALQLKPINLRT